MTRERAPVEPLSRAAWNRVEAGLFARLEREEHLREGGNALRDGKARRLHVPLRRWIGGGLAFAAAAALGLWWSTASVREHDLAPSGGDPVAEVGPHETRIVTTEAPTETMLGDAHVTLAARSDVTVSGSERAGWQLRLDAGAIDCAVAPRLSRPPFVVHGGEIQVTVVGTRFTVTRDGARARVDVREGHVRVDGANVHVLLAPGESWPPIEGGHGVANGNAVAPEPTATAADSRAQAASLAAHGAAPAAQPAPAPEQARTELGHSPPESAQQRYERAARLEAKAPRAALAVYERLSRGKGPWAQNALYARARLELEGGHQQRAESLLRRYQQRFPHGLNARDVETLLARIEKSGPGPRR
jgi:FecR-like protein